ncbi:MAG: archaetidylserine decarboxylase [Gammaproteobacteria bacterium]|nr:archaetidylserine decarboxylase [Gammaproteobacteria bacterium]
MLRSFFDRLFALFQYILPHHPLSRVMLRLTRSRGIFKDIFTPWFIKNFNIEMELAEEPDWKRYDCFNSFFTRALKADARPVVTGENAIASPVDACISQAAKIRGDNIFQAKGHQYSLNTLVGGDNRYSDLFENGTFATMYLSPRDYHRIHMPIDGTLKQVIHVPGRLFSVSPGTTRNIPGLFARNERVVCIFETAAGPMAMILVGAIFVSSIETVWQGVVTPPSSKRIRQWDYHDKNVVLKKGEEMGRFNMGSTVILLFAENKITWDKKVAADTPFKMGELLGNII